MGPWRPVESAQSAQRLPVIFGFGVFEEGRKRERERERERVSFSLSFEQKRRGK